jgi:hypothetical protein
MPSGDVRYVVQVFTGPDRSDQRFACEWSVVHSFTIKADAK